MPTATPGATAAPSAAQKPRKATAPQLAAKSPARKVAAAQKTAPQKPVVRKSIARPEVQASKTVKSVEVLAASKVKTPKKPKLVRDSFTMPKDEYQAIDVLKERATHLKRSAKKSELLRAGIMALSAMDDASFAAVLAKVPALKTGRPSHK